MPGSTDVRWIPSEEGGITGFVQDVKNWESATRLSTLRAILLLTTFLTCLFTSCASRVDPDPIEQPSPADLTGEWRSLKDARFVLSDDGTAEAEGLPGRILYLSSVERLPALKGVWRLEAQPSGSWFVAIKLVNTREFVAIVTGKVPPYTLLVPKGPTDTYLRFERVER